MLIIVATIHNLVFKFFHHMRIVVLVDFIEAPICNLIHISVDDDDVSNPVAAAQARGAASLNANDQTGEVAGNRGERRAKKKGGKKSRRR